MNDIKKRASGQRPKKRKKNCFHGNQFTKHAKVDQSNLSASAKKLCIDIDVEHEDNNSSNFEGYTFIDNELLFSSLQKCLSCNICHGAISVTSEAVYGLVINIKVTCASCGLICSTKNSRCGGVKGNSSDLNKRFFLAMRCIGKGHSDSKTFCGVMDLPAPVSQKSYDKIVERINIAASIVSSRSMVNAVEEEIKLTGATDLIVSGDGTWKTRGHTSRYGATSLIGSESGKVIDCYVSCSYCKGCEHGENLIKDSDEYKSWKLDHEKKCDRNHTGSSAMMEVDGVAKMFRRSEEKHGVRYTKYIGDGDCKTFAAIQKESPYSIPVSKIECVGHIQKRMGSRLRKLKTDFRGQKLADKKPLSGKGRLTDVLIDRLTSYYGNAIRKHSNNAREMQKAIWAIWYHKRSTDSEPTHDFCPKGSDSWCGYQKALAHGKRGEFHHKNSVPPAIMDVIKPIFKDLSHPDLLKKCVGGFTQNVNECLNSLIWRVCPKTTNSSKKIVEIAVNTAVSSFNDGKKSILNIMREMEIAIGNNAIGYVTAADKIRLKNAEKQTLNSTLEARIAKRRAKKSENEKNILKEGVVYASGVF